MNRAAIVKNLVIFDDIEVSYQIINEKTDSY
jgi:hypothetical protein